MKGRQAAGTVVRAYFMLGDVWLNGTGDEGDGVGPALPWRSKNSHI